MTQFTIPSEEDLPLRGVLDVPERARGLVVIVHGFKGFMDWGFFPWLAERFFRSRLAVCRFNMSRSGIGEDSESFDRLDLFAGDTYSTQVSDLLTVVRYAQEQVPELPTFLLGHSRGGGVALLAAQDVPRLEGVATWSAISRADRWDEATKEQWRRDGYREEINARTKQVMRMSPAILDDFDANHERLNILAAAERLTVPLLVMHGGRDESVPVAEASQIYERASDASLMIIENAGHTYNAIHPLIHVPHELSMAAHVTSHFFNAYA